MLSLLLPTYIYLLSTYLKNIKIIQSKKNWFKFRYKFDQSNYYLVKMTSQIVFYFISKKDHTNNNDMSKLIGFFFLCMSF
jgi:hypothetical protein